MLEWLRRNAGTIEAGSAMVTAAVALAALVGVWWQVTASRDLAALQSARDAYRGHLALAVSAPALAAPEEPCDVMRDPQTAAAYDAFVAHLLYAAEQMLEQQPEWETLFRRELEPHLVYLCTYKGEVLTEGRLDALLSRMVAETCPDVQLCR